jgi:C1A family cysteine protease
MRCYRQLKFGIMLLNFNLKVLCGKRTETQAQCSSTAVNVKIMQFKDSNLEISDLQFQKIVEDAVLKAIEKLKVEQKV